MSKSPSVISRVIDILNLFSEDKVHISIGDISTTLNLSVASTYRYANDLQQAGLLLRSSSGHYRLGPKIIELEYLIQSYDPVLKASRDLMERLAAFTGCNVLMCNFYDATIVNMLHIAGKYPIKLSYTKGMRMPLFKGAQAHIMLAYMNKRRLRRLYDASIADPALRADVEAIGADWKSFNKSLKAIRSAGYFISCDQLDPDVTGIATPVFGENDEIVGSLVLIHSTSRAPDMARDRLAALVSQSAGEISKRLRFEQTPAGA